MFGRATIRLGIGPHSSSFFFPRLSQRSEIGCLPYFHTWCGLSSNLECRSEVNSTQVNDVLHVARWKYRTQEIAKNWPSGHHRTKLSGCRFATKACIDNWKKTC